MSDDPFEQFSLNTSSYSFSAIGTGDLEASEYTIVTIAVDDSGSIAHLSQAINECLGQVILACRRSPRADNLMIRIVTFASQVHEFHGFKLLMDCSPDDYKSCVRGTTATALNDAAVNAIEAASVYADKLKADDYDVNGLVVIITDGCNNNSTNSAAQVKGLLRQVQMNEQIDGGLHSILIGCETDGDQYVLTALNEWKDEAGIAQYIPLKDVKDKDFAKIAQFISRSISSQSQALATGGPSQALPFDDQQQAGSSNLTF